MKAIFEAVENGRLDAEIKVVCSNNPDAPALAVAKEAGAAVVAVSHRGLTREEHEERVLQALAPYGVDYVVLAGYMRVLTSKFLKAFADPRGYFKVINIHPSLLPAFPGANAYEDAFAYGVKVSGITVHLVDEKVDHGPILAQQAFPRLETDSLEEFKRRGLAVEHRLYPEVLQSIAVKGISLSEGGQSRPLTAISQET
jgi:phosphoribosylglycinamide formyltransferase-1